MANRSIVLLVENPFTQRDYERFGIDIFLKRGYRVKILQVTPITKPHVHRFVGFKKICDFHCIVNTLQQFQNVIEKNKNSIVISFVQYGLLSFCLFRMLSKYNIRLCVLAFSGPFFSIKGKGKWLFRLQRISIRNIIDYLFRYIKPCWLNIKDADICLVLGGQRYVAQEPIGAATKIIYGHAFDYDLFLKRKLPSGDLKENIAVFLDEYAPYHPDDVNAGVTSIDATTYYGRLNNFFNKLEQETGLQVVVAAHPRSDYELHGNVFGKRRLEKGQTIDLIAQAKLVVAHMSTAVNFAILMKKPILLFATEEFMAANECFVLALAQALGKKVYDAEDQKINFEEEMSIDYDIYEFYKKKYISVQNDCVKNSWEILCDTLEMKIDNAEKINEIQCK
ncbi:MAG: hypothetical protein PWQ57_248 [Desulfovibrionales bacterium]|nr:hypothetical protein [Desulfovibrionales bacterium]